MARIVLVHGIGQERESADSLEATWLPSLAGGVRIAGFGDLADTLWRDARPGPLSTRMAFYGDLFRTADQQGTDDVELTAEEWAVAGPLAREWLDRIALRATRPVHRLDRPLPLLLTLGSPLSLRTVVYDRLRPQPPAVPPVARRWVNLVDLDDLVAAEPDLSLGFPGPAGVLESGYTVDNGARPHEATFYLTARETGRAIASAL